MACIDNQASSNIMSLSFAQSHSVRIEPHSIQFTLADGSTQWSAGRGYALCAFGRTELPDFEFHIFESTAYPIVLGQPFIREAKIDPLRKSRFRPPWPARGRQRTITGTETPTDPSFASPMRLQLSHNSGSAGASAILDRGSTRNLMSLSYAKTSNYHIARLPADRPTLLLGNGALVTTSGTVRAALYLSPKLQVPQPVDNVEIPTEFIILDGLPFDVAIGNQFIRDHSDIYRHHTARKQVHYPPELSWLLAALSNDGKTGPG